MPNVELYSTPICPYCSAAKDLLRRKDVAFTEFNVMGDAEKRREMIERTGGRMTVPQIFIGGIYVGGCDELYDLEQDGKLDPLLAAA